MSTAATKKAIKSIKTLIEQQDHETAITEATSLLKQLNGAGQETEAAQVLCFRGLSLTHVGKQEEAEKCYLTALKLKPSHPLATKALRRLYETQQSWDKLGRFLEGAVQIESDIGEGEACAAALQELLELRVTHGPEESLYRALGLLLPSSPLVTLLRTLTPPTGSYTPFPTPTYPPTSLEILPSLPRPLPHALHLLSSLPLLMNLLIRSENRVHQQIESKVKIGRQRIGGGTEKEVRKNVEAEVLGSELGMEMVEMLREVAGYPGVDDLVRREVEVREFGFWKKLMGVLSSENDKPSEISKPKTSAVSTKQKSSMISSKPPATPAMAPVDESTPSLFRPIQHPRPTKKEAFSRAEGLAKGFVLLGVGGSAEEAWSWVIEGLDEFTLFYDLDLLHRFAMTFPESSLTDFIDDYCRWFRLPLPLPEEEDVAPVSSETTEEKPKKEKKQRWRRNQRGQNAKERRKARRMAGKEGTLAEDVDREERDELVASMTKLLDKLPRSIFAHRVVARISIEEEDWANAIAFAEKGRILVKELEADRGVTLQNVKASLDTALGVALVPYFAPKHHSRATRLLSGVLRSFPDSFEARFARAQISQAAGKWQEARKNLEILLDAGLSPKEMVATKEEVGWCLVNEGELEKGRDVLEEVVEIRDARWESEHKDDEAIARARAWYRLGRTEWMIGDDESKTHAEEWFMASIRALPSYAPAYTALGICYSSASPPDEERALKCYQKAFELDATEAEAGHLLAIGYANDDEWAQVRIIAMRVMQGEGGVEGVAGGEVLNPKGRFAPNNGWAWKALGSTEVHYKNFAKAAQAYQIALRADPDDVSMWVMLGDSYVRCGRHTAGLKTLQHALELDPTSWLAMYHIGGIYSQLGSYDLAIESFEKVAEMTKGGEMGVVAALAQAMLDLGKQAASGGFRERSRRAFRNAIKLVGEVLAGKTGHRPWAWKVIGDASFQLATQEATLEDMEDSSGIVRSVLELLVEDDSDRRSTIPALGHPSNLLQTSPDLTFTRQASVFAFAYRVHLLKNEPRVINSALYDLATSLHALAQQLGPDTEDKRRECIKAAVSAVRGALERDAGDEKLWNALGVICADGGKQLAQHAFVVALELYTKDPIVWGNLGYLYLDLDDLELANACFLKAQTTDPDYAPAWLGQGLLADRNGDKDHAKALFAHAVTLSAGSLLEADLALAASTFMPFLVPGSKLDASILQQPAFALRHYVHQRPTDAIAAHLYALVCERIGLIDESVSSLERATLLFEAEFERTESTEIETQYSFALCNLGRLRLAAAQYDAALKAFTDLWGLISDTPPDDESARSLRIQVKLGQALALFWLEKVDESLEAFQAALDECGDETSKEEVAVILSRTLWGLGGDDAREVAKSHLLECLSHESPSIKVITTLAAIATLTADDELVEATLSELSSLRLNRRLVEDTTDLTSLIMHLHALVDGQPADAEAILEASVHEDPANTVKRNRLARFLIAAGKTDQAIGVLEGMENSGDTGLESERFKLAGLARVKGGDGEGLKELQKAVRAKPWDIAAWEALVWAKNEVPVEENHDLEVSEEHQVEKV
ncbi:putative translation repressor [Naematelia encephala]|uniref:Putative translation repressor n=1 Tax=Naematelia encephala TaxID=71784 RepID=A0A1Y2B9A9_9TREE|nr:putative translation repressor [Naematelia encephala]